MQADHLEHRIKPDPADWLPRELVGVAYDQSLIPKIAKDKALVARIEQSVADFPTRHEMRLDDSRNLKYVSDRSIHLVVTSPPYWTLKTYNESPGQLGSIASLDDFLDELDKVWRHCLRVLVTGGRLVCVVGDVCLSRRKNAGEHSVIPLHAAIQERCRSIGFTNLAPIIWHKIANAQFEADGNGGGFLGKPYEPNAVIKNDIEFILMERKPGGYRSPSLETRILSVIPADKHRLWFQQIWTGLTGASTRNHPAPYPLELAERLVRMFSFVGDTVLDPFAGTGTTAVAAMKNGRNSIGFEVDPQYCRLAQDRLERSTHGIFRTHELVFSEESR